MSEMEAFGNHILAIDNNPDTLELINVRLHIEGYDVFTATNGEDAWKILEDKYQRLEVIIVDKDLPSMDGMDLLRKIKNHPDMSHIPVIIATKDLNTSETILGINAGAYYYLNKPFSKEVLLSIVNSAISDYRETCDMRSNLKRYGLVRDSIFSCNLKFSNFDEINDISIFLSSLFPNPGKVAMGVQELIRNSVEHGNLEITYEEKTNLIKDNSLLKEINRRQKLDCYKNKKVSIDFHRHSDSFVLKIQDEGNGFDWTQYMEVSPERVTHNHGRGIAMANLCCFDNIEYSGNGNTVTCIVHPTDFKS